MSSELYRPYDDEYSESDQASDSDAEVEQNNANKKRTKGSSPNLEDFLPSEKRAKFTKSHNTLVGQGRSLHFGDEKGTTGKGAAEEEDSDSDLEILREEAAREQASKAQQELQKRRTQDKSRGKAGGGAAAKGQPEGTWNDRQLVARSRAWLNKKDDVQEDDDEIELLGGSSDEESPLYKKTNRRNQNEAVVSKPADDVEFQEEDNDVKASEVIMIIAKDKNGNEIQCQVRRQRTFSKLFSAFALQAAKNGWLPTPSSKCRFVFDGETIKETDTAEGLDIEDEDVIEVRYV